MTHPYKLQISPGVLILVSFLFVITTGYFLLQLPMMRLVDCSWIDLWFTAASATCVTGLSVLPITTFTFYGKCVLLGLIQVGGLGLMTLSFSVLSLFLNFGIADRLVASKILDFEYWGRIKNFLTIIVSVTLIAELLGSIALYPIMLKKYPPVEAFFNALFYSVSAFCNAGISPEGTGVFPYAHNYKFMGIIGLLVFAGSTGFFVWQDLALLVKRFIKKPIFRRTVPTFSLHTKVVFLASFGLIAFSFFLYWFFEWNNSFKGFSMADKLANCLFNAVSLRSAGFSTIDYIKAALPVRFVVIFLMLIGGNPASTASGIKTTTFVLLVATIIATVKSRSDVEIFNRTIPSEQVYKALVILGLSIAWLLATFFLLLVTDGGDFDTFSLFFEHVSAFSTGGLSVGIVSQLSVFGKCVLILNMIVGRVGILTLLLALARNHARRNYKYPEERVLIG
jgi:trk system potassium uptake protein TrkH